MGVLINYKKYGRVLFDTIKIENKKLSFDYEIYSSHLIRVNEKKNKKISLQKINQIINKYDNIAKTYENNFEAKDFSKFDEYKLIAQKIDALTSLSSAIENGEGGEFNPSDLIKEDIKSIVLESYPFEMIVHIEENWDKKDATPAELYEISKKYLVGELQDI